MKLGTLFSFHDPFILTREALTILLKGDIYHMNTVAYERQDHHPLWRKALAGNARWVLKICYVHRYTLITVNSYKLILCQSLNNQGSRDVYVPIYGLVICNATFIYKLVWYLKNIIISQFNIIIFVLSDDDWRTILAEYRGGLDYPISFFYKEIYKAYPNAKVI